MQLAAGVPFSSDADLQTALAAAGAPPDVADAALSITGDARADGLRSALVVIALLGLFPRPLDSRPAAADGP